MLTNENKFNPFNYPSAMEYAKVIIPWLEKETGLKANVEKLPLPYVQLLDGPILYTDGSMAAGIYDHAANELIVGHIRDAYYTAATLAHELVHWLENANGWFDKEHGTARKREVVEELAYRTQVKFMRNALELNPEDYGMTNEFISRVLEKEKMQGQEIGQGF